MSRQNLIALFLFSLLAACSDGTLESVFEDEEIGLEPSVDTSKLLEPKDTPPNSGIQDHSLFFAVSEDGDNWERSPKGSILKTASVPNLLLLAKDVGDFKAGTLISHFVDASEIDDGGEERIGYITSEDEGATWSDLEIITLDDLPEDFIPVDPSVVQLEDKRLRLYFFDAAANVNLLKGETADSTFYSAVSEDGETFTFEGEIYSSDVSIITDPEVFWFEDSWLLYNPAFVKNKPWGPGEGQIQISKSKDGTNFEYLTTIDFEGIPGVMVEGGIISLFGCSKDGITRIFSEDGLSFDTSEVETLNPKLSGCDPDPVQLENGTYVMMLKDSEKTK